MIFGGSVTRIAAFALMALIWGLTWLPMKLAAEAVPPIFLATVVLVLLFYVIGAATMLNALLGRT